MGIKIVIGIYGGLSLIAAILQGKYKNIPGWSAVIMGLGGLMMLASLLTTGVMAIGILSAGALLAHISAVINGIKMHGEVNKVHHFARFLVTLVMIAGMVMYQGGL